MPAYTRVCQAEQWPPAFPADDQSSSLSIFWAPFFCIFNFIVSRRFYPHPVCQSVLQEFGSQVKAVSPGWFGPRVRASASRYSAWLNKQHRAGRGREGRRGSRGALGGETGALFPRRQAGRLGGPDAGGTEGALFLLFCAIRMGAAVVVWGASARPRVRLYRSLPPYLLSHKNGRHSLTHTRPSISSARSAGGAQCFFFFFFVAAQESEQTSSQRKRGLLLCQLPGKSAFYCH